MKAALLSSILFFCLCVNGNAQQALSDNNTAYNMVDKQPDFQYGDIYTWLAKKYSISEKCSG